MPNHLEQKINDIISPTIEDMGYEIVRVKIFDGDARTLQIMAENSKSGDLIVEDCQKISNAISTILDVEDPIDGEYNLEVSSPGIDRPLVRLKDFVKYSGHIAKITTYMPVNGRKRYRGELIGLSENEQSVIIQLDDLKEESQIEIENIESAKLVLTDELIKTIN